MCELNFAVDGWRLYLDTPEPCRYIRRVHISNGIREVIMRKVITSVLLLSVLTVVGCSGDSEAGKNQNADDMKDQQSAKAAVSAEVGDTAQVPDTTTPAAKTYPIRDQANPFVTLVTDQGNMVLELYRDVAPIHVDSFLARTRDGFYSGTTFHRIINNFMIQGGDPKGDGTGNNGYYLPAEFSQLPHQEGTLSMARAMDPNSASCQFFICLARNPGTQSLDGQYTVFGQLIHGFEALHALGSVPVMANPMNPREMSKPTETVFLRRAFVSDSEGNELK